MIFVFTMYGSLDVLFPTGSLLNVSADGRGCTPFTFYDFCCCGDATSNFLQLKWLHACSGLALLLLPWRGWKYCYRLDLLMFVFHWIFFIHIHWNVHSHVNFALMKSYNLQVQNPHNIKYNGTIQGLKYIWRTEGFHGLFKGNGTNCARIVPNSAVKFFSYEQASKYDSLKILISLVVERRIYFIVYRRATCVVLITLILLWSISVKENCQVCSTGEYMAYMVLIMITCELCKWFRIDCALRENAFKHSTLIFIFISAEDWFFNSLIHNYYKGSTPCLLLSLLKFGHTWSCTYCRFLLGLPVGFIADYWTSLYQDGLSHLVMVSSDINCFAFFSPANVGFFVSDTYTILLVLGVSLYFFLQTFQITSVHDSNVRSIV
jgi:hypothetical protein